MTFYTNKGELEVILGRNAICSELRIAIDLDRGTVLAHSWFLPI
jgi:hypothetical protein